MADPQADAAFAETWDTFCGAPCMQGPTPGHREAWAAGRSTYAVWAVRVESEALHDRVTRIQSELGASLRPVPLEDLHVTTWVAGFPTAVAPVQDDDIPEEALERQAAAVQGLGPFRLRVGGANSFTTAPFLEVFDPEEGLLRLRQALTRCGPPELRFASYQPHITLATALDDVPTAPLREVLGAHRGLTALELPVEQLVQLRFDARLPGSPLHTHCTVPLR